eukprot:SAG31_NODE_1972_length_6762_cov_16.244635_5_plen_114_part_00
MDKAVGVTNIHTMGLVQFGKFARACKLVDKKTLPSQQIDRIFQRANMDRNDGVGEVFQQQNKKKKMKQTANNPDNELVVSEFAAALIRIAHAKYRMFPAIHARLKQLIEVRSS